VSPHEAEIREYVRLEAWALISGAWGSRGLVLGQHLLALLRELQQLRHEVRRGPAQVEAAFDLRRRQN
jgi:hypothetical protein